MEVWIRAIISFDFPFELVIMSLEMLGRTESVIRRPNSEVSYPNVESKSNNRIQYPSLELDVEENFYRIASYLMEDHKRPTR